MLETTAGDIARVSGGAVVGEPSARAAGFTADSRTIRAGQCFVAVRGGHAFVAHALSSGASLAVVERAGALPPGAAGVVVGDTVRALGRLAADARTRLRARVVAITGSTGKTLTKDVLASALRKQFSVHASPRSYNNEVGLPLAVLGCPPDADVLVLEMGARRPGDVAALSGIARAGIAIVTGIGCTHLEIFGTRSAIAAGKGELLEALPADGVAVVPSADDFLGLLAGRTSARVVTVGPGGTVRPVETRVDTGGRARVTMSVLGAGEVVVRVPVPGVPMARNAGLALAAAVELGMAAQDAADAISWVPASELSPWRMEITHDRGRTIVNDAYNSNPTSAAAALWTVRDMAGDRPAWAVLGEMAELGRGSARAHLRLGRLASALGYERVIGVGVRAAGIAEGAGACGVSVVDATEAVRMVTAGAPSDAIVLVKASRVAGLESVARAIAGGTGVRPAVGA